LADKAESSDLASEADGASFAGELDHYQPDEIRLISAIRG
jgi:hypothetical protein